MIDHFLVLVLVLVVPIAGRYSLRRLIRHIGHNGGGARLAAYRSSMISLTALTGVTLLVWFGWGRSGADIGLTLAFEGPGLLALALSFIVVLVFAWQLRRVRRSADVRDSLADTLGNLRPLLPHVPAEGRAFTLVSVFAGIGEEIVYRGFLLAYLAAYMTMPAAVLVGSAIFGWAHFYQGPAGILKTGAAGLVFALLYVVSGSLLPGMIAHFAVDALSGWMSVALNQADSGTTPSASVDDGTAAARIEDEA